jgi:DNA-directed RNA polymerase specialized sigma24 family protein
VIQDYVLWLIDLYARRTRTPLDDQDMVNEAVRVLRRHASRWLGNSEEQDFISLVAAEMAGRLQHVSERVPPPPFLTMLERSTDAVRHRVVREAQKRSIHLPAQVLNQTAAPAGAATSIEGELTDALTVEEQTVLSLFLDGVPVQEVARELKVSLRTIYRRLSDIKLRLSGMNPHDLPGHTSVSPGR